MRELMLFDEIQTDDWARMGFGVSARMLREALHEARGEDVLLHVNSPGGVATEGLAMQDAIVDHGRVTGRGTGLVASAATMLFPRAHRAESTDTTRWMIHQAANFLGYVVEDEILMYHDSLKKTNVKISELYAERGNKTAAEYLDVMKPGVYLDASEWLEQGQLDEVTKAPSGESSREVARFDPKLHAWMTDAPPELVKAAAFDRPWEGQPVASMAVLRGKYGVPTNSEFAKRFEGKPVRKPLEKNTEPDPPAEPEWSPKMDVHDMEYQLLDAMGED